MSINGTYHARVHAAIAIALLAAAIAMASCGAVGPDETQWQDVRQFSTGARVGDSVSFVHRETVNNDTVTVTDTFDLVPVTDTNYAPARTSLRLIGRKGTGYFDYFVAGDTLTMQGKFSMPYAIVGPMQKGRSWDAAFVGTSPSWRATVTERFLYRTIGGKTYENVVEVTYLPLLDVLKKDEASWICYFAHGVGLVQARHNVVQRDEQQLQIPNSAVETARWTLVDMN